MDDGATLFADLRSLLGESSRAVAVLLTFERSKAVVVERHLIDVVTERDFLSCDLRPSNWNRALPI